MKTSLLTTAVLCAVSLGLGEAAFAAPKATPTPTASPSPSASPAANVTAYDGFLLGTKITGSHVKNLQNQDIGTIDDLVINPDTGRVRFAVLGVGGFVGAGETKVVVPWGAVGLEKNKPGEAPNYVIDATKDKLEKAPKFDASKMGDLYAAANAQPIFDYYDIIYFDDTLPPQQTAGKNAPAKSSPAPASSPAH